MNSILGVLREAYLLLNQMSPYLLFGFLFAGILHIIIKSDMVSRHLGRNTTLSVIKASLFGIPLPLCSCSVVPAAMSLRKEGASQGAVLSFFIATPTTGVDSILATYSLLGGLFTIYRIIASFLTGVIAGLISNLLKKGQPSSIKNEPDRCKHCGSGEEHVHSVLDKIKGVFTYAFGDLLRDSGTALVVGILIGGVIAYFVPESFIEAYMGSGLKAMIIMLLVGIPMYVCATASIPIAAALMLKGMAPGAALVFLIAGPATNIVTMMVVKKNMGTQALVIYLSSIIVSSLALGALFDVISGYFYKTGSAFSVLAHHQKAGIGWMGNAASIVLMALVIYTFGGAKLRRLWRRYM
ncbi:MAG: SO_0444 family Cu/Zn efflux transporter [Candidatus Omnitrophica bacterium]|nr:SO_0444 family Cu/Zn efflux transporter [Candidatus Omnitrophota bacterium]